MGQMSCGNCGVASWGTRKRKRRNCVTQPGHASESKIDVWRRQHSDGSRGGTRRHVHHFDALGNRIRRILITRAQLGDARVRHRPICRESDCHPELGRFSDRRLCAIHPKA
jgi:hypothetical protein